MMPPLGDVEQTLLDAWNNHRTSHSEKAKDADNDASNVNCGGEASEGLKGINLATGVDGSSGLASPEAWMAAWRAKHSTKAGKVSPGTVSAAPSLRRLDLNGMPKWAKISDVLSLVHGGAVERVTVDTPGHAIVLFCNENDSKTYFSRYEQGIRIAEDELIITLELGPEQHPVDKNLLAEIVAGATRVVSITAASHEISHYIDKALQGDYQIDQIIYRADTDKVLPASRFRIMVTD